jgi:hypothetical protein
MKAPQKSVTWNAASIPALLLLGTLSGTAVASTEIQAPCPETVSQTDVLHVIIEKETQPLAETRNEEKSAEAEESAESPVSESSGTEFTTRLPGVSANDMPGFRRHMFRTDI